MLKVIVICCLDKSFLLYGLSTQDFGTDCISEQEGSGEFDWAA